MALEKIEKQDLKHFFDNLSRVLPAETVEIEVVGLDIGDQVAANNIFLNGISYDDASDELLLDLSDVAEHTIAGPQEVWVDQDDEGLKSIEVQCKEGHRHIIKFK